MTTLALFAHPQRLEAHEVAARFARSALDVGLRLLAPSDTVHVFADVDDVEVASGADLARQADLVVAIGGDGTLLYAYQQIPEAPLVGVHAGELGYLAAVRPEDVDAFVADVADEKLQYVDRSVVEVTFGGQRLCALNDVVLGKGASGRAPKFRVSIDGGELATMLADALVASTPTGSTGYTFSARGPIVTPGLAAIVLTPVAPHALWDRSLVLGPGTDVVIDFIGDRPAGLQVDGCMVAELTAGDSVGIRLGPKTARLVDWGTESFASRLRRLIEPLRANRNG